jgi:predicted Zn-dependent protease
VALTNQYGVSADARLKHYVMLVGLTVASASPNPNGNWVFGVLESSDVNAFSGPNGYVFVTRGAIARMHDEAELAGVLAHEISHVCTHDGLKQVQAAEQRGALSETMKAGAPEQQQFAALADAGVDAITKQGYTQPQEFAADTGGVGIMAAAGYDPASYLRFLQRLAVHGGGSGAGGVMSTHPGLGDRVLRVSRQLQGRPAGGATLAERFAANVGVRAKE